MTHDQVGCMQGAPKLDNINLFSIITIMSFLLLAPITLLTEGVKFTPSAMQAIGIANTSEVIKKTLIAGLCFHSYQQASLTCASLLPSFIIVAVVDCLAVSMSVCTVVQLPPNASGNDSSLCLSSIIPFAMFGRKVCQDRIGL